MKFFNFEIKGKFTKEYEQVFLTPKIKFFRIGLILIAISGLCKLI